MAVQSSINADDEWFAGEDRALQFDYLEGITAGIEGWTVVFELYPPRAKPTTAPLLSVPAVQYPASAAAAPRSLVAIDGDTTADLDGVYQFVLRRTDDGARAILAFGDAEIRAVVNA